MTRGKLLAPSAEAFGLERPLLALVCCASGNETRSKDSSTV